MDNIEIHDEGEITGKYILLPLETVSYYPTDKMVRRIALSIYGVDLEEKGLMDSEKYNKEIATEVNTVDVGRPLGYGKVEGDFMLFLPEGKPAWGLMDIRKVISHRPDVNLSIVSPLAMMPNQLHIVGGGIYNDHAPQFSVTDRDGSHWTIHCKFTDLQRRR